MPFTFSNAFNRFFALLGANFVPFAIIGIIGVIAPAMTLNYGLYTLLHVPNGNWIEKLPTMPLETYAYGGGAVLLINIINLMALAALTEVAILRAVGKRLDIGAIIGHVFLNVIPIVLIGLFVGLMEVAGFALLIVPGIIWSLAACVAIPAYVGQRDLGIFGAIGKSFALTRNHRWTLLLLFIVIGMGAGIAGSSISAFSLAMPGAFSGAISLPAQMINALGSSITDLLLKIFVASLYVSLRESKEKLSPDMTATVFE